MIIGGDGEGLQGMHKRAEGEALHYWRQQRRWEVIERWRLAYYYIYTVGWDMWTVWVENQIWPLHRQNARQDTLDEKGTTFEYTWHASHYWSSIPCRSKRKRPAATSTRKPQQHDHIAECGRHCLRRKRACQFGARVMQLFMGGNRLCAREKNKLY
jgi:hypothetical protein